MRWERASLFNFEFTNGGKTTAEQILRPEDRTKSKKRWTVRITGRDLSRKGNHLRKLVREINIIRDRLHYVFQFHQNRWTTRFQQPLWRTSKSPKTNIFAEELIERTLFRLDEIASKMRTKKKTAINRRKNSKPINKVKPIKPEQRFQT